MDMPHKIKMDYFVNGYSVITGGSCLDLPVAVAAGNLSKPAYQSYLAIRVAKENWDFSLCPWADDATQILSYLGFKFENLSINTWEELMFNLKKAVSKNLPLFIPVSYGNILYVHPAALLGHRSGPPQGANNLLQLLHFGVFELRRVHFDPVFFASWNPPARISSNCTNT